MLAAVVGGAVMARADDPSAGAAQSSGGLALSAERGSLIVDRVAQAGADKLTVANHSPSALDVTVKARPWTQSASGVVSPNRRGTLAGVSISEETFPLARGATKELTVTLNSSPAYLYGALEVVGLPTDTASRKGVVAGYRLISSLRYRPATATSAISTGAVKIVGSGKNKALTVTVRNTGNTLEPVTGTVKLKSALGTQERVGQGHADPARQEHPAPARDRKRAQARHLHGDDHADAGQEEDDRDEEGHGAPLSELQALLEAAPLDGRRIRAVAALAGHEPAEIVARTGVTLREVERILAAGGSLPPRPEPREDGALERMRSRLADVPAPLADLDHVQATARDRARARPLSARALRARALPRPAARRPRRDLARVRGPRSAAA